MFDTDNVDKKYPLRQSFYVDDSLFSQTLDNFIPKGISQHRKNLYSSIIDNNSKKIIEFFKKI